MQSEEPIPGPSSYYQSTEIMTETEPLNPRFRKYNLRSRRKRDSRTVGLALLAVITAVGVCLALVFGLTESPNKPPTSLETDAEERGSPLMLLTSREWPIKDYAAGQTELLAGVKPLTMSQQYLNKVHNASMDRLNTLDRLEERLNRSRIHIEAGSASYKHQHLFLKTSPQAVQRGRDGMVHGWSAAHIKEDHNMTGAWYRRLSQVRPFRAPDFCGQAPPFCDPNQRYRSADGTCNNMQNPRWGSALHPFRRVLQPDYQDGVFMPRWAHDGGYLPAARQVSRMVFTDEYRAHPNISLLMMQWGQFIDHDITLTAAGKSSNGAAIRCCGADIDEDPTLLHPECMPLLVSFEDPVFATVNVSCLDFVRSSPAPLCNYGPRQQMNQITSFLDGSNIYGSSELETRSLRNLTQGKMLTQMTEDGRELLPRSPDPNDGCNKNASIQANQFCFRSGDVRVNEQISLAATHTQWVRKHNQVAWDLADLNPHWNDEKIFQESRRIVVAMMQHITYNEYIPLVLGEDLARSAGLLPQQEGYFSGYSPITDPTISNVFATAAFRFGHSQIQGLIKMAGPYGRSEQFIQLHRLYFNPMRLYQPTKMDALTRGQLTTQSRRADGHLTSQITGHLFEPENSPVGLDLGAINVQRGRDHGLPAYNVWRARCGLPPIGNFTELRQSVQQPEQVDQLETLYRSVDHVDLYVGGLLENPLSGAAVGPTFACLLTDQFLRLKEGDRFWYETDDPAVRFTPDQLQSLRRANLARVLCDTSDSITRVQVKPLLLPSVENVEKPCNSPDLPGIDLSPWLEVPSKVEAEKCEPCADTINRG